LAIHLSEWAAQGDWRLYFLYRDRLEQVTSKDVSRVAREYLQPSNRTVGVYYPTKEAQRTVIPASQNLAEMIGEYKGRGDASVGEAFDVNPAKIEARTKRTTIEGIKVALLSKKTRGNTVVLRLNLRFGDEKSLFGLAKVCEFLPSMMTKGTKQLTRQQLQDQLDKNLGTLGSSGSAGEATFAIQTKRDNLTAVIDLLRQVIRDPVFPAAELDILKQGHRSDLEQGLTEPQQLALKAVRRVLNPYPVGDVRYFPTGEEEIRMTDEVDATAIKKLYGDFIGAQAGTLVVVGDFDEEATMKALSGMLKGWKSKQSYERIARRGDVEVKADLIKIKTPDKANAFYFAGSVFPLRDDNPDYPALIIGNYIFGAGALSSRLGDRIRQREGLSYGVGSSILASSLDTRATLTMSAIYNPANLEKIVTAVREELDKILESGVTQKELDDARKGFLQSQEVMRTDDSRLASVLESTLVADRTMEFYSQMEQRIVDLTPETVRYTLQKYIDPKRILTVVAGDWDAMKRDSK
jgi:zinc protease